MAGEMFDMARETVDHATRTVDLFRSTPVMDEIVAIQTDYVKDFFVYALHPTRRYHELFLGFPRGGPGSTTVVVEAGRRGWLSSIDSDRRR
jgi:hypothetical protein